MEVAARELLPALVAAAPGVRFTAFLSREGAAGEPWGELMPAVTVPVSARNRPMWVAGEQALLPPLAARQRVTLVHSLASTAPLWGPFRRVVTVHDLIYARFPEAHAGIRDLGMRVLVPLAVRRAHRVIAISERTRGDLVELLGADRGRIDVVPQGVAPLPARRPSQATPQEVLARLGLGDRQVLLSLSAKRPHKNLGMLIAALAAIPPPRRPVLILPGYPTWHEPELRERARSLGVQEDVRFLGWVSAAELEELWSVSDAFVFPSLYEGFGLPLLEAMARGVPVASSDASSLPEVAGDAALLFDPRDERALVAAIERLLAGGPEVERLRRAGHERVAAFTWRRTAELTLASYARALGLAEIPASWTRSPWPVASV